MAKRIYRKRVSIPVHLTEEQRAKLENLWFRFGNHGIKHTNGNHGFIQGLIEHGYDFRLMRNKYTPPTPECEACVDEVLRSSHLS